LAGRGGRGTKIKIKINRQNKTDSEERRANTNMGYMLSVLFSETRALGA
jgi:hypothetical protein